MTVSVTGSAAAADERSALERATIRKVVGRCIPLLLAAYIVCYLDRVNVGFAALTANADLGLSPAAYGWGAGILFLGYALFEVPSNLMLEKVGARVWLARIMVTWGLVSGAMMFVKGPQSFYIVRFLLGVAEAGFFPGVILYLTYWLPARYRAHYLAVFTLGIPLSGLIGAPLSGLLLGLNGVAGLKGWQWLYGLEAAPALLLGAATLVFLADRPATAAWLAPEQRDWLETELAAERAMRPAAPASWLRLLRNPRTLALAALFFGGGLPSYGLSLWLPQIVKSFGLTNAMTGLVSSLPYAFGAVAMVLVGRRSDKSGERVWHAAVCALVAGFSLSACAFVASPIAQIAAICLAAVGIFGLKGPFLAFVSESFPPAAAAAGIAIVSSIGNLSGWLAPYLVGLVKEATGSFQLGLLSLGLITLLTGVALALSGRLAPTRNPIANLTAEG